MELKIQIVEFWKTWNTNLTLKILNKPESRSPNAETLGPTATSNSNLSVFHKIVAVS